MARARPSLSARAAPWIGGVMSVGAAVALLLGVHGPADYASHRLALPAGLAPGRVTALDVDRDGRVYVLARGARSITVLDERGGRARRIGSIRGATAVAAGDDGRVWVSDEDGVRGLDGNGSAAVRLRPPPRQATALARAPAGHLDVLDAAHGLLLTYAGDGRRTRRLRLAPLGIHRPTAIATGPTGTRYLLADRGARLVQLAGDRARTLARRRLAPRALVAPPGLGVVAVDAASRRVLHFDPAGGAHEFGARPVPAGAAMTVDCRATVLTGGGGGLQRQVDVRRQPLPCPPASPPAAGNLLQDPGGEAAFLIGARHTAQVAEDVPGWTTTGHLGVAEYAAEPPMGNAFSAAAGGGLVRFVRFGLAPAVLATARQRVRLPAAFAARGGRIRLSAVLFGPVGRHPQTLTAQLLDAAGRPAGRVRIAQPARAADPRPVAASMHVGPGRRTAVVTLVFPPGLSPYADNLTLSAVPG